jgi:abortive infection bacteriophage resistance protein
MDKTWWMDNKTFSKYQTILEELRGLCSEHSKLIPKLRGKTATKSEWKRVVGMNKRITKLEDERKKILDSNPLLAKNISKYLK